jgi:hypothetical protein
VSLKTQDCISLVFKWETLACLVLPPVTPKAVKLCPLTG